MVQITVVFQEREYEEYLSSKKIIKELKEQLEEAKSTIRTKNSIIALSEDNQKWLAKERDHYLTLYQGVKHITPLPVFKFMDNLKEELNYVIDKAFKERQDQ